MTLPFYKYQGAGNDFVILKKSDLPIELSESQISFICSRRWGVGSDGLMILADTDEIGVDFNLQFFNPDGSISFCGNGSRCAVSAYLNEFSQQSGLQEVCFSALDGLHVGKLREQLVEISMSNSSFPSWIESEVWFLNTGSPHLMIQVEDISRVDVIKEGKDWRWDKRFQPTGTNVNFIEQTESGIAIRTFEKGVEDETLSCGTGVTACSLLYLTRHKNEKSVEVNTKGGRLWVEAQVDENGFSEVKLIGQVKRVFSGLIDL